MSRRKAVTLFLVNLVCLFVQCVHVSIYAVPRNTKQFVSSVSCSCQFECTCLSLVQLLLVTWLNTKQKENAMVKVLEVIGNAQQQQPAAVVPTAMKQQQRVNGVMQQIAAADAKPQPATEMDKILAMRQMAAQKKQADFVYAHSVHDGKRPTLKHSSNQSK
jgi:hypothetical protein